MCKHGQPSTLMRFRPATAKRRSEGWARVAVRGPPEMHAQFEREHAARIATFLADPDAAVERAREAGRQIRAREEARRWPRGRDI